MIERERDKKGLENGRNEKSQVVFGAFERALCDESIFANSHAELFAANDDGKKVLDVDGDGAGRDALDGLSKHNSKLADALAATHRHVVHEVLACLEMHHDDLVVPVRQSHSVDVLQRQRALESGEERKSE